MPRAAEPRAAQQKKRRPPQGGLLASAIDARPIHGLAAQRLAAFGGVDATVPVEVAAREVALGLGHELGLADEAIAVPVHAAEEGLLPLELAVRGQHVAGCRGRAGEQLVLAELAVLVGVELLETRFLAARPFGAVDEAVLVGIVAHD